MDLTTRKRLYALWQDESLAPDDPRNVDFDHDELLVRGVSWVERLAAPITLADRPTAQLITGLPGSGKSTELRRLEAHLRGPAEEPGYLVAKVDSEEAFDLTQPIDVTDIIAVLVDAAEKTVLGAEGAPEAAEEDGFLVRLWHWLSQTEANFEKIQLDGGPAKLTLAMKTRPAFREQIRGILGRHFPRFLEDACSRLEELDQRAREAGWKGLCLILDSLEKLRGLSSNWNMVLESAERVFDEGPHLKLPVHCLYTVPPALVHRLNLDVEFMPMVKLRNRDGSRFDQGFVALRELVRKRIGDSELESLLGSDFESELAKLIERSGGYPREIVWMLRRLLRSPKFPVGDDEIERLTNEVRERFDAVITDSEIPLLARVFREKALSVRTEEDRPMISRILSNNVVLRYLNREGWYDLHPAVLDLPRVRESIGATHDERDQQ